MLGAGRGGHDGDFYQDLQPLPRRARRRWLSPRERRRRNVERVLCCVLLIVLWNLVKPPTPVVTVTIDGFRPIEAERAYDHVIADAARLHDLDPKLIRAVIRAESAFHPFVVSRAGAQGLMQLMPALCADMGVADPFDPVQNILAGSRYLKQLLDSHDGDLDLAIASYNAGPGAVARYGSIPPYRETIAYVEKVKQFLAVSRESNGNN
jgi:soluble lytic murein transglycosylase-like protein